jgi:hypothetical protein
MADENIDYILTPISGRQVTQVIIEPWSVRLLLDHCHVHVEGDWKLLDADGKVIDQSIDFGQRTEFQLWRVAGQVVKSVELINRPPYCLTIRFENGFMMDIPADFDGYEDWSLGVDNNHVVCNGDILSVWST